MVLSVPDRVEAKALKMFFITEKYLLRPYFKILRYDLYETYGMLHT